MTTRKGERPSRVDGRRCFGFTFPRVISESGVRQRNASTPVIFNAIAYLSNKHL
jgi:hypothetical protein